jgi:hypothetical protein
LDVGGAVTEPLSTRTMPKIFICYRRTDTEWAAGRLRDALVRQFGDHQIFRDKENVPPGVDWRRGIERTLSDPQTIVLALIGPSWVTEQDRSGQRLIDSVESTNRIELETAMRGNLPVFPVLVGGASMPSSNQLPEPLRPLTAINALTLRDGDWPIDIQKLIATLEQHGVEPAGAAASHDPAKTAGVRDDRNTVQRWLVRPVVWLSALVAFVAIGAYYVATRPEPAAPTQDVKAPAPVTLNPTAPNFQIVLDRSDAMKDPFGAGTKLDGAKNAVKKAMELVADSDNVAYREFGGQCEDGSKSTQLLIPFAPGKTLLEEKLNALATTSGRSTVVSAVVAATGNFDDARFKESRLNKIILITGDYRDCESDPAARIRERLRIYPEVKVDLHFIGAGLTAAGESGLRSLARDTGIRATVHNVRNPAEMDAALQDVLLIERRVDEVREAVVILNQGIDHLRGLVEAIGKKDYASADQQLALAVGTLARTVVPKPESGQPEDVRQLLELAQEERNDQQRMLDAARDLIAASKSGNIEGERKARSAFNTASVAYAKRLTPIEQIQEKLLSSTR